MTRNKYKKRSDGYFEAKVSLGRDDTGKLIRKTLYAKTSAALEEKVSQLKYELKSGTYVKSTDTTVKEYINEWYKTYKSQKETNTKAMYKNIIDKHIIPCIGELQIKNITKQDIQNMINSRFDKARTCQQIVMIIKQVFDEMKSDKLIAPLDAENLTNKLSMPKYKSKQKRALNKREQEAIKKADFTDREKAFIYVIFYFGLRREEALGLQINDFDFNKRKLSIRRAVIFDINNQEIKGTKSFAGERDLNIPTESYAFLKYYVSSLKQFNLFTKLDGTEITKSSFQKMWDSIIRKMNAAIVTESEKKLCINPIQELTPHYFRHNYCTLLYYSGITIGKAVELMGHSDYKMIMNIYKHLDEEKENTSVKIDNNIKIG